MKIPDGFWIQGIIPKWPHVFSYPSGQERMSGQTVQLFFDQFVRICWCYLVFRRAQIGSSLLTLEDAGHRVTGRAIPSGHHRQWITLLYPYVHGRGMPTCFNMFQYVSISLYTIDRQMLHMEI